MIDQQSEGIGQCAARQALPRDIPVLAIFERELAKLSFPDNPIVDLAYHERKLERAMASRPEGMLVLLDDASAEVVAWLWLDTRTTLATREAYGIIRSIYVRPDYRGQGLGRCLAEYARRYFEAADVKRVYAKLHAGNHTGITLLEQIGFEQLHVTMQLRKNGKGKVEKEE